MNISEELVGSCFTLEQQQQKNPTEEKHSSTILSHFTQQQLAFTALRGEWQEASAKLHVLNDQGRAITAGESPCRNCASGEGFVWPQCHQFVIRLLQREAGHEQTVVRERDYNNHNAHDMATLGSSDFHRDIRTSAVNKSVPRLPPTQWLCYHLFLHSDVESSLRNVMGMGTDSLLHVRK